METARHTGTQASLSAPSHYQHLHTHQWRWTMQMRVISHRFCFPFCYNCKTKDLGVALAAEMLILGRQSRKIWPHFYMSSRSDFCTLLFGGCCFVSFFVVVMEIIRCYTRSIYTWLAKSTIFQKTKRFPVEESSPSGQRRMFLSVIFIAFYRLQTQRNNYLVCICIYMYVYVYIYTHSYIIDACVHMKIQLKCYSLSEWHSNFSV